MFECVRLSEVKGSVRKRACESGAKFLLIKPEELTAEAHRLYSAKHGDLSTVELGLNIPPKFWK